MQPQPASASESVLVRWVGATDTNTFLEPVELGDLVTFRAFVNAAWREELKRVREAEPSR